MTFFSLKKDSLGTENNYNLCFFDILKGYRDVTAWNGLKDWGNVRGIMAGM